MARSTDVSAETRIWAATMHQTRETPIQAMARRLDPHNPLPFLITARIQVPFSSKPEILLGQLDKPTGTWPPLQLEPVFPDSYPRPLDTFRKPEILCEAFDMVHNGRLEWLGDAIVAAAIARSTHRTLAKPNTAMQHGILWELGSRSQLAHLGLLYGLQLHDLQPQNVSGNPGLDRMCKLFEAFVAAVAIDMGVGYALDWLADLFDPWVDRYAATHDPVIPAKVLRKYQKFIVEFPERAAVSLDTSENVSALLAFGRAQVDRPSRAWQTALSPRDQWPDICASGARFDETYPPWPPVFKRADARVLTNALTAVCGYWDLKDAGPGNEGYQWLGNKLLNMAITHLSLNKLPSATNAELDDVRLECMNQTLLARLGLIFELDVHLRILHPMDEGNYPVCASQSAEGFCAFVAAVYLQHDWDELLDWLDPLLSPWILAAAAGHLRLSTAAESQRQERLKHRKLADELKLLRAKACTQTQALKHSNKIKPAAGRPWKA